MLEPQTTPAAQLKNNIKPSDRVGRLAAKIPQASRVFARYHIDYCCGGNRSLAEACELAGIEAHLVIDAIKSELEHDYGERSLDEVTAAELISHIQRTYHEPLREELPRLEAMAAKVARVHGERKEGKKLADLASVVTELKDEVISHLNKEDNVLFPMILSGNSAMAQLPINRLQHEHDEHAEHLRKIRMLTNDFKVPKDACMTWRALWQSLAELERSLHEHIHLENNILFSKTLVL